MPQQPDFIHLHVHTEYSLLDGMCRIRDLVTRARELGMDALAITDHGALHGSIQFYQACREAGIKPIIGCEAYVAPGSLQSRGAEEKRPFHLVLLAKDQVGYRNLIQIATVAGTEGFYYKPRVDKETLARCGEGLVALSACKSGEVPRLLAEGRPEDARAAAAWYRDVFGDFFLELQEHGDPEQQALNAQLVELSSEMGIPLVATNDVHYVHPDDAYAHSLLLCIQTNTTILDEQRMQMVAEDFYVKSPQQMAEHFAQWPQALESTRRIADMCNLELEFNRLHLPEVESPAGLSPDEYLSRLCEAGLRRRYEKVTPEVEERLRYELEVIRETEYANYFLVVWDFVTFARERGILNAVRGSAAASLVLYCLGVTDVDPLEHKLVFERFLNVERREMPDIDMDFADDRRDEVIAYLVEKYGSDHVAQIITFGTLGARAALRDVGRALGMPYGHVDQVARLVPPTVNVTLEEALATSPELVSLCAADDSVQHLVETARKLEGTARHASTHAAAVVISREPLTEHVALQRARGGENGTLLTQLAMDDIARIGLLKVDVLGLTNLTILARSRELIEKQTGQALDLLHLPLDDPQTYELLSSGQTTGVFQLEGAGMRRYIKDLRPSTFGDIAAMVALYRPGPMQHIATFIQAKHGKAEARFPHPALSDVLQDTYGVIVYQDQVLLIARTFAGYSLGEADVLRKAMGKKIPEVMRVERERFVEGAVAQGFSAAVAGQVFDLIEPFAGYAFNKAHAVQYALIAYQTAYLKAHYPAQFMAALLSTTAGNAERTAAAVAECLRLGIEVRPPDVNRSQLDFSVEPVEGEGEPRWAIRFGLAAIKNVGAGAAAALVAERERGGEFSSVEAFCRRADAAAVNRRVLESLVKAGALDSLGDRGGLLAAVDRMVALAQREQKARQAGQATMFDLFGQEVASPLPSFDVPPAGLDRTQKLAWEKELLGVYVSEHPFAAVARRLAQVTSTLCGEVDEGMAGQRVVIAGMVASVRHLATRDGRPFVAAVLEDLEGGVEVTAWPETYSRTQSLWQEGAILLVSGRVRARSGRVQVTVEEASAWDEASQPAQPAESPESTSVEGTSVPEVPAERPPSRLYIRLYDSGDAEADNELLRRVVGELVARPGKDEVQLVIEGPSGAVSLDLPRVATAYGPELHSRLAAMLGEDSLTVEPGSRLPQQG